MIKQTLFYCLLAVISYQFVNGRPKLHFNETDKDTPQRVVFGSDVPEGQYIPYQVSLQYLTKSGINKHFCSGSIISNQHVLTAAHCCPRELNYRRMSVVAGIRDLTDRTGIRSKVQSVHPHANYEELLRNDIAILKIEPPLEFSERIMAINVSNTRHIGSNTPVTLTGWGLKLPVQLPFVNEELNFPSTLQVMNYSTISNDLCKEYGMNDVTDGEICAHSSQLLPQGACVGDSGGPLVTKNNAGIQQVGIVSYGFAVCGLLPDVYTRVSHYTEWIQKYMNSV